MSDPETLIQSQQVTLTGPKKDLRSMLNVLDLFAERFDCTVTIHTPSVTDATVGVTEQSQQKSRQDGE